MKKILVTGAGGFIGSHLTTKLLAIGYKIIALDIDFPDDILSEKVDPNLSLVQGSVFDLKLIEKLVARVDQVIHLAAVASPVAYVTNPKATIDINLNASIQLIEILRHSGKQIFFTSTSEVFGKNPNIPWAEDADRVLGPTSVNRWCYSTSKAMIEHYLLACAQEHSIEFSGIRIFNCYGPRLRGRVVDNFMRSILNNKKLQIHGDGTQTRCFTYIDDLIKSIICLIQRDVMPNRFFNIGSTTEYSINELAKTICTVASVDFNDNVEYISHDDAIGTSYEDIPRRVPNSSLAEEILNWYPETDLFSGMKITFDYEKSLAENLNPLALNARSSEADQ